MNESFEQKFEKIGTKLEQKNNKNALKYWEKVKKDLLKKEKKMKAEEKNILLEYLSLNTSKLQKLLPYLKEVCENNNVSFKYDEEFVYDRNKKEWVPSNLIELYFEYELKDNLRNMYGSKDNNGAKKLTL